MRAARSDAVLNTDSAIEVSVLSGSTLLHNNYRHNQIETIVNLDRVVGIPLAEPVQVLSHDRR